MEYLKRMQFYMKYGILILSISFILIGMIREEHLEVLRKATKICLECIGVG